MSTVDYSNGNPAADLALKRFQASMQSYSRRMGGVSPAARLDPCAKDCPCQKPLPEGAAWTLPFRTRSVVRYMRALSSALDGALYPLDVGRLSGSRPVRPHRWAVPGDEGCQAKCQEECLKWNSSVCRDLLAGYESVPPGSDPVLFLATALAGTLPSQVYFTESDEWVEFGAALLALIGLAPGADACPVGAMVVGPDWCYVNQDPGTTQWGRWCRVRLPDGGRHPLGVRLVGPSTPHDLQSVLVGDGLTRGEFGEHVVRGSLLAAAAGQPGVVVRTTAFRPRSGDFLVELPEGRIMVEVKNYSRAVPGKEVEKLTRDIEVHSPVAAILVALGESGVVGMASPCEVSWIPTTSGQMCPLIMIKTDFSEQTLASVCAMGLAMARHMAGARTPGGDGAAQSGLGENVLKRLEAASVVMGGTLSEMQGALSAVVSAHHSGVASVTAARGCLGLATDLVRQSLEPPAKSLCVSGNTWEKFSQQIIPFADGNEVRQVWELIQEEACDWVYVGGRTRVMKCAVRGSEWRFRLLTAATHLNIPVNLVLDQLPEWLASPVLQKYLRVTGGRLDIRLCEETAPVFLQLLSGVPR